MTEQIQIDFTTNKTLRTLSVPTFKFHLHYGRELTSKGKKLEILKAKILVNDNGCFLIGIFPGISDFTFGEWDKDAPSDSKYNSNKGGFIVKPELTPKSDEVICLLLPKSDKLEGYLGFEGLAKYLSSSSSGGKIANSYIMLNLSDYATFVVDPEGNPIEESTATVLLRLGKKNNRLEISFPEPDADFTSIDAVEIPDSFGGAAKSGYGSGSKVEIHQESTEERILARLKVLETRETEVKIYEVYMKLRQTCVDEEDLFVGDFTFIDFLGMILR